MEVMGQIYVAPVARVTDNDTGIGGSGGSTAGGYWINWDNSGYISHGWFWDDTNNYLQTGWRLAVENGGGYVGQGCTGDGEGKEHTKDKASFLIHIANNHASDLNAILGSWDNNKKLAFVITNWDDIQSCIT